MAITDELREFKNKIQIYRSPWSLLALRSAINCIADRIDAAHEADVYAAGLAGSIQYELEHCPACKNVADLQEALAENERLRKDLEAEHALAETLGHFHEHAQAENERLRQENAKLRGARDVWQENDAKLRELVRDIYESAYYEYPSYFESKFADRMHELGIIEEV